MALYIGPGFAYKDVTALRGNPTAGEKTMAAKKKASKKLKKGKKMQPTKTLIVPIGVHRA